MKGAPMPDTASYKVHKGKVFHLCSFCESKMENQLEQAGQQDTCPNCGKTFIVPGIKELTEVRTEKNRMEHQRMQAIQLQLNAEREERARQEAAKAKREEEEKRKKEIAASRQPVRYVRRAPKYRALSLCAAGLAVCGVFSLFAALISALDAIRGGGHDATSLFVWGVVSGIGLMGSAALLEAVRDTAMNSRQAADCLSDIEIMLRKQNQRENGQ
jgi:hypothetical protein